MRESKKQPSVVKPGRERKDDVKSGHKQPVIELMVENQPMVSQHISMIEGAQDAEIREWLGTLQLSQYTHHFMQNGLDSLQFVRIGIENEDDLKEIGVDKIGHQKAVMDAIRKLKQQKGESYHYIQDKEKDEHI